MIGLEKTITPKMVEEFDARPVIFLHPSEMWLRDQFEPGCRVIETRPIPNVSPR